MAEASESSLQIAFATVFDPEDVMRGSGTYYHLQRELRRTGSSVHLIGPVEVRDLFFTRAIRRVTRHLRGRYKTYLDPFISRARGRLVDQRLSEIEYDYLLTPDYGIAAYSRSTGKTVLYTDAIIPAHYRPSHVPTASRISDLRQPGLWFLQHTIRRALRRASLVIFPARWQIVEAVNYGASPDRIRVIPFGANLLDSEPVDPPREREQLAREACRILFVGKDWEGKGGGVAVKTLCDLTERGLTATLDVVGPTEKLCGALNNVRWHGHLCKTDPRDFEKLKTLFKRSHVLLVPSQFEGYGVVFAEAAAYGLPSLAFAAYGVKDAVRDGESGVLLPPGSPSKAFADIIVSWVDSHEEYRRFCRGARRFYETECNWGLAVKRLDSAVAEFVR